MFSGFFISNHNKDAIMIFQFKKEYDVVVAGAGIAGIAAALAAARMGLQTALIEKQTLIGGLATSGLVFVYLPLCDGRGTQVSFGLAEELLKASLKYSPYDLPENWGGPKNGYLGLPLGDPKRYQVLFSPAGFTLVLDELLKDAGVDLWLDTMVCSVQKGCDNNITAIEVENCSGRGMICGKCFVDSTGDATLARRAGSAVGTTDNYKTPWVIEVSANCKNFPIAPGIHIKVSGEWNDQYTIKNALSSKTATEFTREIWEMKRREYQAAYANGTASRKDLYPIHLPAMPQFRKIAHIQGVEMLGSDDAGKRFESSLGLCADWRKRDSVWEIPYGTLLPRDLHGVLAAGRCVASKDDAWEVFRVIPVAAVTGEIAGVSAALAVQKHCDPQELSLDTIREPLRKNGFKFHIDELSLKK